MYNKKDIIGILNEYNYFIDSHVLDNFIKDWKIDPIYEDEDGVEFFDNMSIVKLKKGISLKSQGYGTEEIIYNINKILAEKLPVGEQKAKVKSEVLPEAIPETVPEDVPEEKVAEKVVAEKVINPDELTEVVNQVETIVEKTVEQVSEFKNVTIDVTSQTLQMLADAVAQKITNDVKDQLLLANPLKETNDELSKKVEELLDDNKKMAERIKVLESRRFHPLTWFEKFIESFKQNSSL